MDVCVFVGEHIRLGAYVIELVFVVGYGAENLQMVVMWDEWFLGWCDIGSRYKSNRG